MNRRRASHIAAAAEDERHARVPEHPLIPTGQPQLIASEEDLGELLDHVRSVGRFAYDTEFIGESSYWPKLCLIQIATPQRVAVVDALAGIDPGPIWRLLADAAVMKVVHAGAQDLEPVVRHLDRAPAAVFDTQIAAGFIGLPYPLSLRALLEEVLGVRLGKTLTFTSWDERPLSARHLRYAADDVRCLPALHAAMQEQLEQRGHAGWVERACARQCDASRYRFDAEEQAGRLRGARSLSGRQAAVLCELAGFRDDGARRWDVPPRTFLKDEVLVELARRQPGTLAQLSEVRGLPRPVVREFGEAIVEAIRRGRERPKPRWPRIVRRAEESAAERFHIDGLWAATQSYFAGRGIDPALVATRSHVAAYYRAATGQTQASREPWMDGWRGELLGGVLDALLDDGREIRLGWTDRGLRSRTDGPVD